MTHISKIFPDDPRLTAYALGELEGEELAAVEAALRDDPAARAAVDEIRAMAMQLESALGAEAAGDVMPAALPIGRDAAIIEGRDPRKLDGGPLGKLIRFPSLYYLVGGLAAAAFAMLVIQYQTPVHMPEARKAENMRSIAVTMPAATNEAVDKGETNRLTAETAQSKAALAAVEDKKSDQPTVAVAAVAPQVDRSLKVQAAEREKSLAEPAPQEMAAAKAPVSSDLLKENAQEPASVGAPGASDTVTGPVSGGTLRDEEAQKLSKFEVASKDTDRLDANSAHLAGLPVRQQRANQLEDAQNRAYLQTDSNGTQLNSQGAGNLAKNELQRRPEPTATSIPTQAPAALGGQRYYTDANGNKIHDTGFAWESKGSFADRPRLSARIRTAETDQLLVGGKAKSQFNTESYAYQNDNDFLGARENPLSTFSVDVDTASYANVRRFLNEGRLPPPDAVRIKELVNYFPYRYASPEASKAASSEPQNQATSAPFAASMEVADAPWAPTHRLVRIGLKGREVSTASRGAANLVFLLDVSGSMDEPNKLPLVKESMRLLIGKLRPDDRVAIVIYAGASGLALPSTPVAKSQEILDALDSLSAGGSTNGAMGIQLAYDIAKANFVTGGINRVILCTDGDFNVGVTGEGDLTRLIEEKAKSGVFLTVLGFGMGNYKDATLEKLADKGNGNYGYVDSRREAEKLLVEQVSGTLVTIAKDVKLQVEFNPAQVASYRLIGYENRLLKKEDFNNDAVDAGEIGAGHTVTALYEIVPISQAMGQGQGAMGRPAVDALKYQEISGQRSAVSPDRDRTAGNRNSSELLTLKVRFKEPAGTVSRKLEFPLTDAGARFADASTDFKFAAAVAEFGMILRDSPHKGTATLADVLAWAQAGTDNDAGGYRGEFVKLVQQAQALMK